LKLGSKITNFPYLSGEENLGISNARMIPAQTNQSLRVDKRTHGESQPQMQEEIEMGWIRLITQGLSEGHALRKKEGGPLCQMDLRSEPHK
jgi:hypothetical protein